MIKHLLKMVWNRKRINGLIMIEIFVSFLVLFVVLTATAFYVSNYYKPLGYSIDGVWSIHVDSRLPGKGYDKVRSDGLIQLENTMKDLPEIESVGYMWAPPYEHSTWIGGKTMNGQSIDVDINQASDEIQHVLAMPLIAGRWFSAEDNASLNIAHPDQGTGPGQEQLAYKPVVINESYARLIFGSNDPIGKSPLDSTCRIVGVVKEFRKAGEFSSPVYSQIQRIWLEDTSQVKYGFFLIHVHEGTTIAFQEKLVRTLASVEKDWSFDVKPLSTSREADFKLWLAPLIAGGIVAAFLLIMVALGLIGVLWQNVTQRTREIGLRRALGGTAKNVSWQIHGEQLTITTLSVLAGSILVLQLPLLDLIGFIRPEIYFTALVLSLILIYILTYLCSIFPSWMAMDIEPAEALHYD